ncbi:MAG: hypothetical protein ABW123_03620 [Cystobacter sp.]
MLRLPSRWFLLSSLLLSACDPSGDVSSPAPEEALGHTGSALCEGATVSTLSFEGASSYAGVLGAMGKWSVTSANSIHLKYFLDGRPLATSNLRVDAQPGNQAPPYNWQHSSSGVSCGSHTFQVQAWPRVVTSGQEDTTCLAQGPKVISMPITQDCPAASVSCRYISNQQVSCWGGGSGGTGGSTPSWHQQNWVPFHPDWYETRPWHDGDWSYTFYCEPPLYASMDDGRVQVDFKVRDSAGMESVTHSQVFYCKDYSIEHPYLAPY